MNQQPVEVQASLVDIACKELRMPGLKQSHRALARDALEAGHHPTLFLAACLEQEMDHRKEQRLKRYLRGAKFPVEKTLDTFDFTQIPSLPKAKVFNLASGAFIEKRENVLCLGTPGTEKSHIATAIGISAILTGYRVRFISVMQLIQELQAAEEQYQLPKYLKSWQKMDLVILDELGFVPLGAGGTLLFQFCTERYERGSLLITTNLEFAKWVDVFGDATLTTALLDRLTHHAHILPFTGESFRFRESQKQMQQKGAKHSL